MYTKTVITQEEVSKWDPPNPIVNVLEASIVWYSAFDKKCPSIIHECDATNYYTSLKAAKKTLLLSSQVLGKKWLLLVQ